MEYKTLNNGLKMPMVGLGVYNISERETQRVVEDAISVGYRSIDTAAMYYNEKGVGDAVRACGVPREELFVTTKICDSCYTKEETMRTVDHSMKQLGLDYVDLMLIHWPVGNPTVIWHTLEELYKQGMFKAIGVSNFYPKMIENINLFDFTLTDEDLREIRLFDTGRNVTGWPSDALNYNPEVGSSNY